jgi:hypothetical protein
MKKKKEKRGKDMTVYKINIVGESYRQGEIKLCREGESLILKREPKNKYDKNAVAVLRKNGNQIGYISREDAIWLSEIMDEGNKVEARINLITGGVRGKPYRGVIIDVNTTPKAGWDDGRKQGEGKISVAYVRNGELYHGEVTPSEKEVLDTLIEVDDAIGGLFGSEDEEEKKGKKEEKTHKGFWRKIFGG